MPAPKRTARAPRRGEIWLAALDPTLGSEIQKTRPCVVVSPPEMNEHLRTMVVAPKAFEATTSIGSAAKCATGTKSFAVSYGSSLNADWLIRNGTPETARIV